MKTLTYLALILFVSIFSNSSYAQIHFGHLIINDQAALDTFDYEEVTGVLIIEATDTINSKITDLSPLASLKIARSNFGLTNIHAIDYSALNNLESVGKGLFFDNCRFADLTFLSSLTSVEGFSARNMHNLTSLDGLQFLTTSDYLYLYNLGITDFQGLNNLQEVRNFRFQPNNSGGILQSCDGLQALKKADWLDIRASAPFSSFGLNNVDTVTTLYFHQLSTFSHMNIESVEYIYCNECTMTDFSGLENIQRLGNFNTSEIAGFIIQFAYNLTSTKGLENLTESKFMRMTGCPVMKELNFENLDSVGSFSLFNNPALESTASMQSLIHVDSDLFIRNNSSLIDCCAFENVIGIPGLNVQINNNPFPCNSSSSITNECSDISIWTAGDGTNSWNTPGNWDGNFVPDFNNSSTVIIPSDPAGGIFPIINQDRKINKLVIGKLGEMTIDSKQLHVSSVDQVITATILGKLTIQNSGELRIGDTDQNN